MRWSVADQRLRLIGRLMVCRLFAARLSINLPVRRNPAFSLRGLCRCLKLGMIVSIN